MFERDAPISALAQPIERETHQSICDWHRGRFGTPDHPLATAAKLLAERANAAMGDLVLASARGEYVSLKPAEVVILLHRYADVVGLDLDVLVAEQMKINRSGGTLSCMYVGGCRHGGACQSRCGDARGRMAELAPAAE